MRALILMGALALAGCQTHDTGAVAARMEAQDHGACKGRSDYSQCRTNLFAYRRQAVIEERLRQDRGHAIADSIAAAGRAMQSIDNNP